MNKNFDAIFTKDKNINFFPFIGDYYMDNCPRIMVLGESHYLNKEEEGNKKVLRKWNIYHDLTRESFKEEYKPYSYTISMLTNLVIENNLAYEKFVFYNYFQKIVGYGSSDKSLLYANYSKFSTQAQRAYFRLIEILEPELIIVWGTSVMSYKFVPQFSNKLKGKYANEEETIYRYDKYPNTNIWHMDHPSNQMFNLVDTTNKFKTVCKQLNYKYPIIKL